MAMPIVAYHLQPAALARRKHQQELEDKIREEETAKMVRFEGEALEAAVEDDVERRKRELEEAQAAAVGGGRAPKSAQGRKVSRFVVPGVLGVKEATVEGRPELRLGDVNSKRSALTLADELLKSRSLEGIEQVVRNMNATLADPEAQIKGITTLGHVASRGVEIQVTRLGQAHQAHYDFDIISADSLHIQQAGAIGSVLRAITTHTGNRRLVLRACWALEHMTAAVENKRQFEIMGGEATIVTLEAVYSADKDIMESINALRKSAMQGKTHNACCTIS